MLQCISLRGPLFSTDNIFPVLRAAKTQILLKVTLLAPCTITFNDRVKK